MSIEVVLGQMIMIFIMILIGVFLYRSNHLSNDTSKQLSWIIVNITNPITLLCAALKDENKIGPKELAIAFVCFIGMYGILILISQVLPLLLKVPKESRYEYRMLTIFGNVGFIGIPFAAAVLGTSSLIYVAICGLTFNLIMYTYGMNVFKQVANEYQVNSSGKVSIINTGTVMAVVTLLVYLVNLQVPSVMGKLLEHIGSCTTFMSMIVLGVSVAQMVPRKVFSNGRLYAYILIRQIGVPVLIAYLLAPFGLPTLMRQTIVIMCAMPAANLPLMVAKQFGIQEANISAGIIFTTLASIVTIPAVIFFVNF